jgi:hypothetical protein
MKPKVYFAITLIVVVLLTSAAIYWKFFSPFGLNLYTTGMSDNKYIEIAKQTVEVQKFLEKYPYAKVSVDRSGALAVDFRVDKNYGEKYWKYIRLRIFINPRNNSATKKFIDRFSDGSVTIIKNDLLEYLQEENF